MVSQGPKTFSELALASRRVALTAPLTTNIFGTKHDIDNQGRVLETTEGLLQ